LKSDSPTTLNTANSARQRGRARQVGVKSKPTSSARSAGGKQPCHSSRGRADPQCAERVSQTDLKVPMLWLRDEQTRPSTQVSIHRGPNGQVARHIRVSRSVERLRRSPEARPSYKKTCCASGPWNCSGSSAAENTAPRSRLDDRHGRVSSALAALGWARAPIPMFLIASLIEFLTR
jgi:hypothetical protein